MHLLVRETRTLDDEQAAEDLGQTPGDLVFLSFADSDLGAAAAAWQAMPAGRPSLRLANLARLRHPMSVDLYVETGAGAGALRGGAAARRAGILALRRRGGGGAVPAPPHRPGDRAGRRARRPAAGGPLDRAGRGVGARWKRICAMAGRAIWRRRCGWRRGSAGWRARRRWRRWRSRRPMHCSCLRGHGSRRGWRVDRFLPRASAGRRHRPGGGAGGGTGARAASACARFMCPA